MKGEKERYHGVALARLVLGAKRPVQIEAIPQLSRSAYVIDGEVALYVKYSTDRMTPWQFVFDARQREEISTLSEAYSIVWIALVCWHDGIASLDWKDAQARIVRPTDSGGFSIAASRKPGEKYRVTGSRERPILIADIDFPRLLFARTNKIASQE